MWHGVTDTLVLNWVVQAKMFIIQLMKQCLKTDLQICKSCRFPNRLLFQKCFQLQFYQNIFSSFFLSNLKSVGPANVSPVLTLRLVKAMYLNNIWRHIPSCTFKAQKNSFEGQDRIIRKQLVQFRYFYNRKLFLNENRYFYQKYNSWKSSGVF